MFAQILILAAAAPILETKLTSISLPPDTTVLLIDLSQCASNMNRSNDTSDVMSLPFNMMINIGMDIAVTKVICISPSGVVFADDVTSLAASHHHIISNTNNGSSSALIIPIKYFVVSDHEQPMYNVDKSNISQTHQWLSTSYPPPTGLGSDQPIALRTEYFDDLDNVETEDVTDGNKVAVLIDISIEVFFIIFCFIFFVRVFLVYFYPLYFQVLTLHNTLLLPVIFRPEHCPHGTGFVR